MNKYLSPADITLPALRADSGQASYLTSRYVRIDTRAVIDALAQEGYKVAAVRQDRTKGRDPAHVRHEVDFRHDNMGGIKGQYGAVPRVLFINSHNGTVRAKFMLGVFRIICSNGAMVGSVWAQEKALHVGDDARQIIERIREASKGTAQMFDVIRRMTQRQLPKPQQLAFASEALKLRFGPQGADRYNAEDMLVPLRKEDEGDDLWHVFNRVQEHGTRTQLIGHNATGRVLRSRGIGSIGGDHHWNQGLWQLAEALI